MFLSYDKKSYSYGDSGKEKKNIHVGEQSI